MLGGERHQSPEPIDPQSSLALNIGGNVFDVSAGQEQKQQQPEEDPGSDPIAQALAELKSVTKNAGNRSTADRYYGIPTPAPAATPGPNSGATRSTPLPNYAPKTSALGLPPPAFTSAEMQQTTQRYVNQRESLLEGPPQMPAVRDQPSRNSLHHQRSKTMEYQPRPQSMHQQYGSQDMISTPRSAGGTASPIPNRSVSPRPQIYGDSAYRQASPQPNANRAVSPNPYTQSRPGTATSQRPGQYAAYNGAPTGQELALAGGYRATSPAPSHHSRNDSYNTRSRSRADSTRDGYGGSTSNRNSYAEQSGAMQMYQGGGGGGNQQMSRPRSKSVVGGGQYARDGRPIIHYGKYFPNKRMGVEVVF